MPSSWTRVPPLPPAPLQGPVSSPKLSIVGSCPAHGLAHESAQNQRKNEVSPGLRCVCTLGNRLSFLEVPEPAAVSCFPPVIARRTGTVPVFR